MYKQSIETGSAAISYSLDKDRVILVKQVRLHLSAAGGAGDLTITLNSALGAAYDVNIVTEDMTLVTDLIWNPNGDLFYLAPDDTLDIAWANANTRTYGLEILYT